MSTLRNDLFSIFPQSSAPSCNLLKNDTDTNLLTKTLARPIIPSAPLQDGELACELNSQQIAASYALPPTRPVTRRSGPTTCNRHSTSAASLRPRLVPPPRPSRLAKPFTIVCPTPAVAEAGKGNLMPAPRHHNSKSRCAEAGAGKIPQVSLTFKTQLFINKLPHFILPDNYDFLKKICGLAKRCGTHPRIRIP
jgi:hypothetical protein